MSGEQLREALLSGLPAHEAVRSVAAEPLSHPILEIAPWLQAVAALAFAAAAISWKLTHEFYNVFLGTGILAVFVVPTIWWWLRQFYYSRPKALLRSFANRLEAGEQLPAHLSMAMPSELKSVMQSDISDDSKAKVAADLVPCLLGTSLKTQQFVIATVGPLAMLEVMLATMYTGMLFIVPQFKAIFQDFGVQLPDLTLLVIGVGGLDPVFRNVWLDVDDCWWLRRSDSDQRGDHPWSIAQELSRIPVLGMPFRWAMQARVARILAAMLRNNCSYPEALQTALAGSDFSRVEETRKKRWPPI